MALVKRRGHGKTWYPILSPANKKALNNEALGTSKQAYLACLFLRMTNKERYAEVRQTLNNNFLLGKQECPQDLLVSKRLLA